LKLGAVYWGLVEILVGRVRKKCHFSLAFSAQVSVGTRWLYKEMPGHWHRNWMVKFASGSLMGKARHLLVIVIVPCHTLQF